MTAQPASTMLAALRSMNAATPCNTTFARSSDVTAASARRRSQPQNRRGVHRRNRPRVLRRSRFGRPPMVGQLTRTTSPRAIPGQATNGRLRPALNGREIHGIRPRPRVIGQEISGRPRPVQSGRETRGISRHRVIGAGIAGKSQPRNRRGVHQRSLQRNLRQSRCGMTMVGPAMNMSAAAAGKATMFSYDSSKSP